MKGFLLALLIFAACLLGPSDYLTVHSECQGFTCTVVSRYPGTHQEVWRVSWASGLAGKYTEHEYTTTDSLVVLYDFTHAARTVFTLVVTVRDESDTLSFDYRAPADD